MKKNNLLLLLAAGGVAFYLYNRHKKASASMLQPPPGPQQPGPWASGYVFPQYTAQGPIQTRPLFSPGATITDSIKAAFPGI